MMEAPPINASLLVLFVKCDQVDLVVYSALIGVFPECYGVPSHRKPIDDASCFALSRLSEF